MKVKDPPADSADRYHHGDLRAALLREAEALLAEQGLSKLSLRQLAKRAGVTAPALYHHFRDKNDLLSALAQIGFEQLDARISEATACAEGDHERALRRFVSAYVGYAAAHPDVYDLMFGRTLWKSGAPSEELREVAYATFRNYVERGPMLASGTGTLRGKSRLRRAQAAWGTVHGLCRLVIDGVYTDGADIDGMCAAASDLLLAGLR